MGEGRIPWSVVKKYAEHHRCTADEFEELWEVVQRLDMVYIGHRADKAKTEQKRIGDKPTPRRRG